MDSQAGHQNPELQEDKFVAQSAAPRDRRLDQGQLYRGMGNGLNRAFELAMIPAIFGLAGYGLDQLIGTGFIFTAGLAMLGLYGVVMRIWYGYRHQMDQVTKDAPWTEKTPEERVRG
jgi:hypothetical protein